MKKTVNIYSDILTKKFLLEQYIKNNLTQKAISKLVGCGEETIKKYINRYNISKSPSAAALSRSSNKNKYIDSVLTKDYLYQKYVEEELSVYKIAKLTNINHETVKKYIKKHNIDYRGHKCKKCGNVMWCKICDKCGYKAVSFAKSLNEEYPELAIEWCYEKNMDLTPDKVMGKSNRMAYWRCEKCKHIYRSAIHSRVAANSGCPKCNINSSKLETCVSLILEKHNINYEIQKSFQECRKINLLKFDFYLIDYNICIECNGIQHYPAEYKTSNFSTMSRHDQKDLKEIQLRDNIKRKFCKQNNIKLVEIKYDQIKDIEDIVLKVVL